jgi:hypothetical protein
MGRGWCSLHSLAMVKFWVYQQKNLQRCDWGSNSNLNELWPYYLLYLVDPLWANREHDSWAQCKAKELPVKVRKVKLSLCLINEALCHKDIWGSGCIDPRFLDLSTSSGGEWSASRPGHFTAGERAPSTHCVGSWVGPRAGLADVEKIKFLALLGLELWPLSRQARSQSLYWLCCPGS